MEFWQIGYGAKRCKQAVRVRDFRGSYYLEPCNAQSIVGVTWQGLTEGQHSACVCATHALEFASRVIDGRAYPQNAATESASQTV